MRDHATPRSTDLDFMLLQEDGALWAQVAALCLEFRVSVNQ